MQHSHLTSDAESNVHFFVPAMAQIGRGTLSTQEVYHLVLKDCPAVCSYGRQIAEQPFPQVHEIDLMTYPGIASRQSQRAVLGAGCRHEKVFSQIGRRNLLLEGSLDSATGYRSFCYLYSYYDFPALFDGDIANSP
jgi:hypothetical protein